MALQGTLAADRWEEVLLVFRAALTTTEKLNAYKG